jgi:hypothetical protein
MTLAAAARRRPTRARRMPIPSAPDRAANDVAANEAPMLGELPVDDGEPAANEAPRARIDRSTI